MLSLVSWKASKINYSCSFSSEGSCGLRSILLGLLEQEQNIMNPAPMEKAKPPEN